MLGACLLLACNAMDGCMYFFCAQFSPSTSSIFSREGPVGEADPMNHGSAPKGQLFCRKGAGFFLLARRPVGGSSNCEV